MQTINPTNLRSCKPPRFAMECPIPRHLLLLPYAEVDLGLLLGSVLGRDSEVLAIAIALVDTINVNKHTQARSNVAVGLKVN